MKRGRKSPADQKRSINAAFDFLGLPQFKSKVRDYKPREDHADLEKHVIADVWPLLAEHPNVLFAVRQNSGALTYEKDGDSVPVWLCRIVTKQPVRISDFWGFLKDGRPFAMECKRPSWKKPSDKREFEQAAYHMLIQNIGGVAGFVRSEEEARALLA